MNKLSYLYWRGPSQLSTSSHQPLNPCLISTPTHTTAHGLSLRLNRYPLVWIQLLLPLSSSSVCGGFVPELSARVGRESGGLIVSVLGIVFGGLNLLRLFCSCWLAIFIRIRGWRGKKDRLPWIFLWLIEYCFCFSSKFQRIIPRVNFLKSFRKQQPQHHHDCTF